MLRLVKVGIGPEIRPPDALNGLPLRSLASAPQMVVDCL